MSYDASYLMQYFDFEILCMPLVSLIIYQWKTIEFIVNYFAIDLVCSSSNASKHIVVFFAQRMTGGFFKFYSQSYLLVEQEMSPEEGTF